MGLVVSVLAGDLANCPWAVVLYADLSLGILAKWRETLLPSLLAAIVGLVVFSVLYASKIVAGRRHVEDLERALAERSTGAQDEILRRLESTPCRLIREGYVDHNRAIEFMRQADVQCLLLSDVPEAGRVVPAKTFEYLALGGKILYVGPGGEVQEILSDFNQAESFVPSDSEGIADYFSRHLDGMIAEVAD